MYAIRNEGRDYLPGEPGAPSPPPPVHCEFCNAECVPSSSICAGYAVLLEEPDNRQVKICYTCAAKVTRDAMVATGRATLYHFRAPTTGGLTLDQFRQQFPNSKPSYRTTHIGNWTGDLKFPVTYQSYSQTNGFGGYMDRYDYRFKGPDGYIWSGRCQGDNDIVRCKRTKQRYSTEVETSCPK